MNGSHVNEIDEQTNELNTNQKENSKKNFEKKKLWIEREKKVNKKKEE